MPPVFFSDGFFTSAPFSSADCSFMRFFPILHSPLRSELRMAGPFWIIHAALLARKGCTSVALAKEDCIILCWTCRRFSTRPHGSSHIAPAGPGIGFGPLSVNGQSPNMAGSPVSSRFGQALYVHHYY